MAAFSESRSILVDTRLASLAARRACLASCLACLSFCLVSRDLLLAAAAAGPDSRALCSRFRTISRAVARAFSRASSFIIGDDLVFLKVTATSLSPCSHPVKSGDSAGKLSVEVKKQTVGLRGSTLFERGGDTIGRK